MNGEAEIEIDYKKKYKNLKRKLKFLVYEQECFQEQLRKAQRKLLKVSRDKSFLLDRLLQYEQVDDDSSDSDATASSENSDAEGPKLLDTSVVKKKKSPQLGGAPPSSSPPGLALQTSAAFGLQQSVVTSSYLTSMTSPPYSQFPSEYLAPGPGALGTGSGGPKSDKSKKDKKCKAPKPKKSKLPIPLPPSTRPDHVGMSFSPPADPLSSLSSSKLPPTTILSAVPQQMFSDTGEGSEDDALEGDDDLVIDIPE
ncbi:INO80 complex subunit E isoform X1 [Latimeria chalumnae]|uniref:INO80 complex subunit E isoform X1 n=1 Tax=Latimeria chalumnae TaxID=7897 RepID=UPI0006D92835|nr:PREDICTED: INO80 complex subunit E-like [Latimeria chalumnae]|eukprot:XP_014353221.1 PREDICTED: INO80 complex subunit E-like [Latimeria chalumnae]